MTTVYQSTRVIWPPQPYYPAQYQSSQGVPPATYEGSSRHSTQLHESRVSQRDHSERRESLRRAEQVRADEALARRVQAEEEQLLLFESMRTAQRDNRRQSLTIVRDRTPSTSTRPSTPRPRTTRTLSIPVEPFIPPQNVDPTSTPSPLRVSTPLPETPESLHQTSSPKTPAQVLREHARLFTKSPPCSRCGTLMSVHPLLDTTAATPSTQLHLTCPRCSTTHCRGCVRPVTCPPHCSTSKTLPPTTSSCALQTCCSRGRAIAVFELLSHFDALYTSAVAHVCNSPSPSPSSSDSGPVTVSQADRALFLELLTSGADDRSTKRFNRSFLSTLQSLRSWLSPPLPLPHSHHPLHLHSHPSNHRTLPALLSTSHLLSVLRAYLQDAAHAHIHWVIHGELYVEILGLLVLLGRDEDAEVRRIVMRPGGVQFTSGVLACVWGSHSSASASASASAAFSERDEDEDEDEREEGTRESESSSSLCALAGEGRIRMDLRKMERRGDVQTQGLVAQLLMDLNHIVCMNVLS